MSAQSVSGRLARFEYSTVISSVGTDQVPSLGCMLGRNVTDSGGGDDVKRALKRATKVLLLVTLAVPVIAQLVKRLVPEHGDERSDHFQIVCLMQGRHWRSEAPNLRSGTIVTVAGGVEVDLREAAIAPEGAHLRVTTLMGGVDIRVPEDWHVRLEGRALMGANDLVRLSDRPGRPDLTVDCVTVMGGVEVRGTPTAPPVL